MNCMKKKYEKQMHTPIYDISRSYKLSKSEQLIYWGKSGVIKKMVVTYLVISLC